MQHTPVDDPARYRLHELGMRNAPKEIREVGIDHFPISAKQQFFHCDRRLLGVLPWPVGILFGGRSASKIGSRTSVAAVMQTRSRTLEMPSGLSLPLAFGIYTRLIGSGRYVSCLSASASSASHRSTPYASMSAKSWWSMPGAPLLERHWASACARMSSRLILSYRA